MLWRNINNDPKSDREIDSDYTSIVGSSILLKLIDYWHEIQIHGAIRYFLQRNNVIFITLF